MSGGRPKRQFTDDEIQQIEQYALDGCYAETIARALDIAVNTLKRRFGRKMRQLRALGKLQLKHNQRELARTNAQMAQFLGKNELNQIDKQVITDNEQQRELSESQALEAKRIADIRLHLEA